MPEPSAGAHDFRPYHLVIMPPAFLVGRGLGASYRALLSCRTWAKPGLVPIFDFGFSILAGIFPALLIFQRLHRSPYLGESVLPGQNATVAVPERSGVCQIEFVNSC